MHKYGLHLEAPRLDWQTLLFGHGWIHLAPNEPCPKGNALLRYERLPNGSVVRFRLTYNGRISIAGKSSSPLSIADRKYVKERCSRMLRLDKDYSSFHDLCNTEDHLAFVSQTKAGRLLRSPTVFEDVIKTILTTNCSWTNTKGMVSSLCNLVGRPFPTPEQVVSFGMKKLQDDVRAGYRAGYLLELSERIQDNDINPELWIESADTEETVSQINSIKGVGTYSLNHILMLLGRYDRIPLDSEIRKWFCNTFYGGRLVSDSEMLSRYKRYGKWQYLAFKFDMIAHRSNIIN